MTSYELILAFIVNKYREVFTSLYSINDDILDENLLHYLWEKNFVILMKGKEDDPVDIWLGESSTIRGIDRYGNVRKGFARTPDQRSSTTRVAFNPKNSVVVYGKRNRINIQANIWEYMTEIASIVYIEQANLRLSNVKAVIEASPASADTMLNVFAEMFTSTKHYILIKNKDMMGKEITKLDMDVEYIAEKYQASILFYHNQILEYLGVNFTPHEKKERLVTNEVDSNNEITVNASTQFMKRATRYLEKANKVFELAEKLVITKNEVVTEEVESVKEPQEDEV